MAHIGFRAVSRVLSLLAVALGIQKSTMPSNDYQLQRDWRSYASTGPDAQRSSLSQAPFSNGFIWLIDISIALGSGKIVAALALDAQHHQFTQAAPSLGQVRRSRVSAAASWTGDALADLLQRLIAGMGRPAAYLKDAGSELHKAIDVLMRRDWRVRH